MQYYHGIVREFVSYAEMIARVIIDEAYLPIEQKSIKPVDVGGVAGGQKYLFKGIFFKFAIDSMGIYGGDSNAAKAASKSTFNLYGGVNLTIFRSWDSGHQSLLLGTCSRLESTYYDPRRLPWLQNYW